MEGSTDQRRLQFEEQLAEKWPQIAEELELPGVLLQQADKLDADGRLQAVLVWLERQGEKKLEAAILNNMPGEREQWETEVHNALKKVRSTSSYAGTADPIGVSDF